MANKTCPACQKQCGPRTKKCDCGHEFAGMAVPASGESMKLDPLNVRIADSVGAVKDILSRAEVRPSIVSSKVVPVTDVRRTTIASPPACGVRQPSAWGRVFVPSGDCPVNPKGFKKGWPDGPAPDEVVQEWALDVFNYGGGHYAPDAVAYWVRHFWDINSQEYHRVRDLVMRALSPHRPDHDSDDD